MQTTGQVECKRVVKWSAISHAQNYAVQIWPIEPSFKPDITKKKLIVDTMLQPGKRTLVGTEKDYVKATGHGRASMTMTAIVNLVNPCAL